MTDRDGEARIEDGDGDGEAARDMGAFEAPASVPPPVTPLAPPAPPSAVPRKSFNLKAAKRRCKRKFRKGSKRKRCIRKARPKAKRWARARMR